MAVPTAKPIEEASWRARCRQNQGCVVLLGSARRVPGDWAGDDRRWEGVKRMQALSWNCRNQSLRCQGRSSSGENRKARVPTRSTGTDRSVVAKKAR